MKGLEYYKDLTVGKERTVDLNQTEECVILKAYDYGVSALSDDEIHQLNRVIGKLKDEIWP